MQIQSLRKQIGFYKAGQRSSQSLSSWKVLLLWLVAEED
jgi:hypothetical protein